MAVRVCAASDAAANTRNTRKFMSHLGMKRLAARRHAFDSDASFAYNVILKHRHRTGDSMKRIPIAPFALFLLALPPAFAQRKATIQNVPEIPFTTVPNFLKLPPGEYLGEAVAVATNSKGHIFIFHRSNTNRLRSECSGNPVYYGAKLPEAPAGRIPRRGRRGGHQFQGPHLHLPPQQHEPSLRIRPGRQVRQGNRQRISLTNLRSEEHT